MIVAIQTISQYSENNTFRPYSYIVKVQNFAEPAKLNSPESAKFSSFTVLQRPKNTITITAILEDGNDAFH